MTLGTVNPPKGSLSEALVVVFKFKTWGFTSKVFFEEQETINVSFIKRSFFCEGGKYEDKRKGRGIMSVRNFDDHNGFGETVSPVGCKLPCFLIRKVSINRTKNIGGRRRSIFVMSD